MSGNHFDKRGIMLTGAYFLVHSLFAQFAPNAPAVPPKVALGAYYDAVAVLLVVFPLVIGASGLGKLWHFRRWRAKAQLVQGDQRGWEIRPQAGPAGTDFPMIFFTADNKQYRCKNCVGYNVHPDNLPSKLLGVLYNPANPEDSYQNTREIFPSVLLWLLSVGAVSGICAFIWFAFAQHFMH